MCAFYFDHECQNLSIFCLKTPPSSITDQETGKELFSRTLLSLIGTQEMKGKKTSHSKRGFFRGAFQSCCHCTSKPVASPDDCYQLASLPPSIQRAKRKQWSHHCRTSSRHHEKNYIKINKNLNIILLD